MWDILNCFLQCISVTSPGACIFGLMKNSWSPFLHLPGHRLPVVQASTKYIKHGWTSCRIVIALVYKSHCSIAWIACILQCTSHGSSKIPSQVLKSWLTQWPVAYTFGEIQILQRKWTQHHPRSLMGQWHLTIFYHYYIITINIYRPVLYTIAPANMHAYIMHRPYSLHIAWSEFRQQLAKEKLECNACTREPSQTLLSV